MTGQASKISRGLRSVGAEIVKLANDTGTFSYQIQGTTKTISLFNEAGKMLNTYEVLEKIYQDWNKMTEAEQSALALTLGMKTQIDTLSATLMNFESAQKSVEIAQNSAGSAMRENSAYMESLGAKINKIRSEFHNLVLGDGGLSDFTGFLLDSTGALLSFANSGLGQTAIKLALLSAGIKLATAGFTAFKATSIGVGVQLVILQAQTLGLGAAFSSLLSVMAPFIAPIAIVAGITAIGTVFKNITQEAEKNAEKFQELDSQYKSITTESASLEEKLNQLKDKIRELDPITDKEEIDNLKQEEESLKRQIELIKLKQQEIQKQRAEQALESLNTVYTSDRFKDTTSDQMGVETQHSAVVTKITELGRYKQELIDIDNQINQSSKELVKIAEEYGVASDQYKEAKEKLGDLKGSYDETKTGALELSNEVSEGIKAIKDSEDAYNDLSDAQKDTINETEDLIDSIDNITKSNKKADKSNSDLEESNDSLSKSFYDVANSMQEKAKTTGKEEDELKDLQSTYSDLGSGLSEIQTAYNTLRGAVEEYNNTGKLSIDTLSSLLQLSPEYLSTLINENGQLILNEQSLYALAEQEKTGAIISLQYAAAKDMEAVASGKLDEASSLAQGAVAAMGNASATTGEQAANATQGVMGLAVAMNSLITAAGQDGAGVDVQAQMKAVRDEYLKIAESIANIKIDFSSGYKGSGGRSSKGAAKGAGKAAGDAYKEAYQKELDSLDHDLAMNVISQKEYYNKLKELNEKYFGVASGNHEKYLDEYRKNEEKIFKGLQDLYKETADYLSEQFDKKIEQIEKAKDAELEEIDAEIEDIERVRDKKLNAIQDQIDAIEKERDTVLDSLEKQKDALEDAQDAELDRIDKELDTLESQRDSVEKYWNDKISALQKANEEIDKQIKLEELQAALEAARYQKVKVFKDGKFQYVQDESAVEEAEQNLADYEEELKRQQEIEALENQRDDELAILDEKISNMENYRDQVKENYDKQIEDLEEYIEQTEEKYETQLEDLQNFYDEISEKYEQRIERLEEHRKELEEEYNEQIKLYENQKEKFEQYVNAQEEQQKRELANQITGLQTENEVWMTRLENLAEFITEYNRMLAKKGEEGESVSSHYRGKASIPSQISSYAVGSPSVDDDELAVVGENPYKEIVIGSTLNKNGSLLKLRQGSGVVNSNATDTLARNLNELAKFGESKSYSNYSSLTNDTSSNQYFNFDKLVLPNVKNAEEFMDVLSTQYKNYMIQTVNSRQ